MILQSSVLAIASALTAGTLAISSLAVNDQGAEDALSNGQMVIHAAVPSDPARALSVYDALGHQQVSPAETYCDTHNTVTEGLTHDFAETFEARKTSREGLQIELWTSDLMGTWTALHAGADGISCVIASGVDWNAETDAGNLLQLAMQEVIYGG